MSVRASFFAPSAVRAIIWDLDNTLYRFDAAFEHACNIASARAAIDLGLDMEMEEALAIAVKSYETTGYSGLIFERDYNLCAKSYHFAFHDAIDEKVIEANTDMVLGLKALNLPHVILTNASKPWAQKVLKHLHMKKFFPDHHIIAQEDTEFTPKARGPKGFEMALSILQTEDKTLTPQHVLMVDDLEKNLRIPKEMGLQTALIHHNWTHTDIADFVDVDFADTVALITLLQNAKQKQTNVA